MKPRTGLACKCFICGRVFTSNMALRNHQSVHTAAKSFACSFCDRSFAHKQSLRIHERIHTGMQQILLDYLNFLICGNTESDSVGLILLVSCTLLSVFLLALLLLFFTDQTGYKDFSISQSKIETISIFSIVEVLILLVHRFSDYVSPGLDRPSSLLALSIIELNK